MGNTESSLGISNLHIDKTNCQVYNDWTMAKGELNGLPITVFSASHLPSSKRRPYIERALQASRVLRHPGLLRYITGGVVGGGDVVLVMEEATPLQYCLDLSPLQVVAGLASLVNTLIFLHDTAGVSHNNLSITSIFVTPDFSWKLWGLEYSCSFSDLSHRYLSQIQSFCHEFALPPDDNARIAPAYQHARDSFSFASLVDELLTRCPALGDVTGAEDFIMLLRQEHQHKDWSMRPRFERLQQHELLQHSFLRAHHHLNTLLLLPDTQRDLFLDELVPTLRLYPESLVAASFAPALLSRPVLLVPRAPQTILPSVLTPRPVTAKTTKQDEDDSKKSKPLATTSVKGLFSEEVFSEHIVPHVVELYGVHDLPVRKLLLCYLPQYVHLIPKEILQNDLLPEILLGLQDAHEELVCQSLQALAVLVPVLGAECVVGRQRLNIFSLGPKVVSGPTDRRKGFLRRSLLKSSSLQGSRCSAEWHSELLQASSPGDPPRLSGRSSPDGGEDLVPPGLAETDDSSGDENQLPKRPLASSETEFRMSSYSTGDRVTRCWSEPELKSPGGSSGRNFPRECSTGFNEIFGMNDRSSVSHDRFVDHDEVVANFSLGGGDEHSQTSNDSRVNLVHFDVSEQSGCKVSESKSDSDGDAWSDWDDDISERKTDCPFTTIESTDSTNLSSAFVNETKILDQQFSTSTLGVHLSSVNNREAKQDSVQNTPTKIVQHEMLQNSKGLGEEFDVLSIKVQKVNNASEEDFFADLTPNLHQNKFDLEKLLVEANNKCKTSITSVIESNPLVSSKEIGTESELCSNEMESAVIKLAEYLVGSDDKQDAVVARGWDEELEDGWGDESVELTTT